MPPPPPDIIAAPDTKPNPCGDGTCAPGESTANCPADCKGGSYTWTCGDKKCDIGEQFYCAGGCPGPQCGDGKCQWPENASGCPGDCKGGGGTWSCGDGKCDLAEKIYCAKDCQPDPAICVASKCSSQWKACQADPKCKAAVDCALDCGTGWNCAQKCLVGGASANAAAVSVLTCAQSAGCLPGP